MVETFLDDREIEHEVITAGLQKWREIGAVAQLLNAEGLSVPEIWLPGLPGKRHEGFVTLVGGQHLEETSGFNLLRWPQYLYDVLCRFQKLGLSFLIYPQLNQTKGHLSPGSVNDNTLRGNHLDVDYNDGFGVHDDARKTAEGKLVEERITKRRQTMPFMLGASLHEDSEVEGKGYVWTLGLETKARVGLRKALEQKWLHTGVLLNTAVSNHTGVVPRSGTAEHWEGPLAVDFYDEGCIEDWWNRAFHVPSVCIEAPYGLDITTRKNFVQSVLDSLFSYYFPSV